MASMTTTPTTTTPLPKLSKNQKKKLFKTIQMDTESKTLLQILTQHLGTTNPDTISIFIQQLHGSGNNETLLHRSCAHGAVENTRFLLPYFLPNHIDVRNSQMKTPLHEACTCGSVDIVSMLLQAGALKDAHRTHSWTPLMYAVSRNHFQVAVLFMQLETNTSIINEVNQDNMTALYLACRENAIECVTLLLQHNADPNICSKTLRSPLHVSILHQNIDIVEMLMQHTSNTDAVDSKGYTMAHEACAMNETVVLNMLKKKQCLKEMLKIKDHNRRIPLHVAALKGGVETVKYLLSFVEDDEVEFNIDVLDKEENTALILAVSKGHVNVVQVLLDQGANPNVQSGRGKRSLVHVACGFGHVDVVKMLLNDGRVDWNVKDNQNRTALELATVMQHDAVVELLLVKR